MCTSIDSHILHTTASCIFASMDKENRLQKRREREKSQSMLIKQQSKGTVIGKKKEREKHNRDIYKQENI